MRDTILQTIIHQLQQHYPKLKWTQHDDHQATTKDLTLTVHSSTITLTSHHLPDDNNPWQDAPDPVEYTLTISLLDPDLLTKLLNDYRLQT